MRFVPLWDSILDSRKLARLSLETLGKWCLLLVAAQRHDPEGGSLPIVADIAFWLRRPEEEIQAWITELVEARLVDRRGKSWIIHDWDQWRCKGSRTSTERVARWREKKRKQRETLHETLHETLPGNGETLPETLQQQIGNALQCNVEKKRSEEDASLSSSLASGDVRSENARQPLAGETGGALSIGSPFRPPHVAADPGPKIPADEFMAIVKGKKKGPTE